ncbi:UPF0149 family protein [Marinomonas epiphytica]
MSDIDDSNVMSEEKLYERLDYYLMAYGGDRSLMCVSELDGFITALGCSSQELEPDQWLSAIWGADEDQPNWENGQQEDEFLSLVLIMYMETMNNLVHGDFHPVYLEQEHEGESTLIVEEWCVGFMRGAKLTGLGKTGDKAFFDEVLAPVRLFGTEAGWSKQENMKEEEIQFWEENLEISIQRLARCNFPETQGATPKSTQNTLH